MRSYAASPAFAPGAEQPSRFAPPRRIARAWRRRAATPWLAILLVVALMWPTAYPMVLGTVTLPPYRLVLLVGLFVWTPLRLAGGAFKPRLPDVLVVLFSLGLALSLIVHHGLFETFYPDSSRGAPIASVGYEAEIAAILETAGAYLIARSVILTPAHFETFMKALGWGVAIMTVFTVVEAVTGKNPFGVYAGAGIGEVRYGLHRAAGTFPHSILWGTFAATPFAFFAAQALWRKRVWSAFFALACLVGVITSVSSTAVLAIMVQTGSLGWAWLMRLKRRWTILAVIALAIYIAVDAVSERPAIRVLASYLTLSPGTAFYRIVQWEYGWPSVMQHPLIGIGMNAWERPEWLSASIDSFWLSLFIRDGLIVPFLLFAAIGLLFYRAAKYARRPGVSRNVKLDIRIWSITIASLVAAGLAVHYWSQSLIVFFFLLGCLGGLTKPEALRVGPPAALLRARARGAR